ncbi:MAG: DNA-formamidopyrimidine glycosylase family protein [Chitinophagaceae bacterium]
MPEGPSIVILKEAVSAFKGKKVTACSGNAKIDFSWVKGQTILDFKTWGKHFLICFKDRTIRIHLLLFGTYRVNEKRESVPRLHLQFGKKEINFYACSVQILDGDLDTYYDWSRDVLSDTWSPGKARASLKKHPDMLVCDALMDQPLLLVWEILLRMKCCFAFMYIRKVRWVSCPPNNYPH